MWISLLLAACARLPPAPAGAPEPVAVEPEPVATVAESLTPPPLCDEDLSTWMPGRGLPGLVVVSPEQLGRMVRPSLTEGLARACACIAEGAASPGTYRLTITATPARGEATARFRWSDAREGRMSACVGDVETRYEGWEMPCSDAIDPAPVALGPPGKTDCAARLVYPVVLDLGG